MATIKELKRMCDTYENCSGCPFGDTCCGVSVSALPDNADGIVDKWVEEHPIKTYMQDFFEKFPNAPKDVDGAPKICPEQIYPEIDLKHRCYEKCSKCWNREMKTE
jgi:hypothetical protein